MARLDPAQIKKRMEKSLTKDKILKRKVEKQKQKEIYQEKWYKDELSKREKELEEVAPTKADEKESDSKKELKAKNSLPTFFDNLDINTLFDPMMNFLDKNGKVRKMDFEKYKKNERLFEPALVGIDVDSSLNDELADFYGKIFSDNEDYKQLLAKRKEVAKRLKDAKLGRIEREEMQEKFNLDISELDEIEDEQKQKELEKIVQEYEEQGFTREDLDLILDEEIPTVENEAVWDKLGEFRTSFFSRISKFFQRYVPIYNRYTCTCCGKAKELDEYYVYYNIVNASRTDYHGNVRLSICKKCSEKLFNYLFLEESFQNIEVATKKWCAYLNIYYDEKIVVQAIRNFNVNEHENHFVKEYLDLIYLNEENIEKTFLDSPFLYQAFDVVDRKNNDIEDSENGEDSIGNASKDSEPFLWTKEDIRNKKQVVRMIGYDPFGYEDDENKVVLYNDLLNILDTGMENDMVKVQAAVQIVLGFFKIRQLDEQEFTMRKANASLADLRALSELKAKELSAISKFCSDNGFSERYAISKAKGENTFTGILKKMNEDLFEDAVLNKYDIDTSVTIQQAAEASITAIFRQLNLSSAEYGAICSSQLAELQKLRKENEMYIEQIRKMKIEDKKEELIKTAKEENSYFDDGDDDESDEDDE